MPDPTVEIKPFDALSLRELHACLKLRGEVFIVGQRICDVPDVDEGDPQCHHAMLWQGDDLVGTARLLPTDGGTVIKVGRVAVDHRSRGSGLGTALMRAVQVWIGHEPGRAGVMDAQAHLEPWYARLGWQREGELFVEAGIDHVKMVYNAPERPCQPVN